MTTTEVPFADLARADLQVDAVYRGDVSRGVGGDPVFGLLPRGGNAGGFRLSGRSGQYRFVGLCTSGSDPDWPDSLDPETGLFTYYGDNKKPGTDLHEPKGNRCLRFVYDQVHSRPATRSVVPPFFVFESVGRGRDMRFRGLAAPGAEQLEGDSDLVAVWRTGRKGLRFQNYKATFTILDAPVVRRAWLDELEAGETLGRNCPPAWRQWVERGRYRALRAPTTVQFRTWTAQLPSDPADLRLLRSVYDYFSPDPVAFEACAASLWRLISPRSDLRVTRPTRDGGRDAIGALAIGPDSDPVHLDFALEAKCYAPNRSVGVRDVARLISRLRHRQFGVLVTTSYVGLQAYQEVRYDEHPVVILSGVDIVDTLKVAGLSGNLQLRAWLSGFPRRQEGPGAAMRVAEGELGLE